MKRFFALLTLLAALLLTACGAEPALNADGELGFPGLRWGMTVSEAEEALKLGEYTVTEDRDHSDSGGYALIYKYYDISIPGMELFVPAEEVRLSFRGYTTEAEPMLAGVTVVYAPDADLAAVQSVVEAQLGPGTPDEYMPTLTWYGENRQDQYMSDGYYLREAADHVDYGTMGVLQFPATWLDLISGAEGHDLEFYDLEEGQFALSFGTGLSEIFQHDPAASRTPDAARAAFAADGMPVFPGTMWSMTAQQVQTALGITAQSVDGKLTADVTFADFEGEAQFTFESWFEGFEPGLTAVELAFSGSTEGLEGVLTDALGTAENGVWASRQTVADFLSPVKLEWYQMLTGDDPTATAAATLTLTENTLRMQSPLTYASQVNRNEQPDPYAEVKALFEEEWYQNALSSLYATPAEIDLGQLFGGYICDGVTGAELETMLEHYDMNTIRSIANVRVTREDMEPILQTYFGVSVEDCDLGTMDGSWMYCGETGAWLDLAVAGTGYSPEFEDCETLENGDVVLFYSRNLGDGKRYAVTLRPNGEQWQVVSNVIAEDEE